MNEAISVTLWSLLHFSIHYYQYIHPEDKDTTILRNIVTSDHYTFRNPKEDHNLINNRR